MGHKVEVQIHPKDIVFIKVEQQLTKRFYRQKHYQPQFPKSNIILKIFRVSSEATEKATSLGATGNALGLVSTEPDRASIEVDWRPSAFM